MQINLWLDRRSSRESKFPTHRLGFVLEGKKAGPVGCLVREGAFATFLSKSHELHRKAKAKQQTGSDTAPSEEFEEISPWSGFVRAAAI